ncbi:unnamed protein product [Urochloa humidicola]
MIKYGCTVVGVDRCSADAFLRGVVGSAAGTCPPPMRHLGSLPAASDTAYPQQKLSSPATAAPKQRRVALRHQSHASPPQQQSLPGPAAAPVACCCPAASACRPTTPTPPPRTRLPPLERPDKQPQQQDTVKKTVQTVEVRSTAGQPDEVGVLKPVRVVHEIPAKEAKENASVKQD